ncbi:MAG TPA: hypothetical protein VJ891_17200 [Casimicrobiaceae bacterium]|nr:hypothetical protein [Casimicrobiaceae bacterium]
MSGFRCSIALVLAFTSASLGRAQTPIQRVSTTPEGARYVTWKNPYIAFTPPPGWTTMLGKSDADGLEVLHIHSPDGKAFIEIHIALLEPDFETANDHMADFLERYLSRLERQGRPSGYRSLEFRHPKLAIAAASFKVTPKRGGTLLVDKFPVMDTYSVFYKGWWLKMIHYATDVQAIENKALKQFVGNMRPGYMVNSTEWKR